jgi:hypothetical protein
MTRVHRPLQQAVCDYVAANCNATELAYATAFYQACAEPTAPCLAPLRLLPPQGLGIKMPPTNAGPGLNVSCDANAAAAAIDYNGADAARPRARCPPPARPRAATARRPLCNRYESGQVCSAYVNYDVGRGAALAMDALV